MNETARHPAVPWARRAPLSGQDAALAVLRRASLRAAQADDATDRVFVIELPEDGRAGFLRELEQATRDDGARFACAADPGKLLRAAFGRARSRRTIARSARGVPHLSPIARASRSSITPGPAALARLAWSSIEAAESPVVLVLDRADHARADVARFWWSLARRLARGRTNAPGLLLALIDPPAETLAIDPWRRLESALSDVVPVRRLRLEPPKDEALPSFERPAPPPADRPERAVELALLRAALAALVGDEARARAAAERAETLAAGDDDLEADAAAALADAVVAIAERAPDAGLRHEAAVAAAALSGTPEWIAIAAALGAARAALAGNIARAIGESLFALSLPASFARPLQGLLLAVVAQCAARAGEDELAARHAEALVVLAGERNDALVALARWTNAVVHRSEAAEIDGAGRELVGHGWLPLSSRAFADAAAAARRDGGDPAPMLERARRIAEASRDQPLLRLLQAAAGAGLGSAGRSAGALGVAESLLPLRAVATASSREEAATAALDAMLELVAARGGSVSIGDPESSRTIAQRGSALLFGAAGLAAEPAVRLQMPLRGASPGSEYGRLILERESADPPFSRDERRVAEAVADFAASMIDALDRRPAARPSAPAADPDPKLDHRISDVERATLLEALDKTGGNLSRAARALGLSRNGLKMKLARHGLRD